MRETLAALASHPVDIAGVAVLVDRSGGEVDLGAPYIALATMDIATWDATDCPLCRRGEPSSNPAPPRRRCRLNRGGTSHGPCVGSAMRARNSSLERKRSVSR